MRNLSFGKSLVAIVSATLLSLAVAGAQTRPQADRVLASASSTIRVPVAGHLPTWAIASADAGAVPASESVYVSFGLSRAPEVQAAFEQLLADQQNTSSAHFHEWLTPQQVGEKFGPTQHDVDALVTWLTSQGFSIIEVTPSRTFVRTTAPVSVISSALKTSLHSFSRPNGATALRAPTVEPSLPADLAPLVATIGGLSDVPYRNYHVTTPVPDYTPAGVGGARPNYTSGSNHYTYPADFAKIYDINTAGITGAGQTIAILGGSQLFPADVSTYESLSGLTAYQPNYIVPPGLTNPGVTNDGNQDEAYLDFMRTYGTAPGASIDLIIAKNSLSFVNTDTMLQYEINTVRDPILSLSFGICEANVSTSYIRAEDNLYSQAAAQGISVFVSSGDAGAAGCDTNFGTPPANQFLSMNADCASSYVTCVGGTQFSDLGSPSTYWSTTNGTSRGSALGFIPEGAWNEPVGQSGYQSASTGGGASIVIVKPTWQVGAGVPADGFRDTPDISFSSSLHDGYLGCLAYTTYDCGSKGSLIFAGTSAAAPSMAGVAALVNQKLGKRQGNFNPLLYKLAATTPSAFHDSTAATSGVTTCSLGTASTCNNSDPSASALTGGLAGFAVAPGFDMATGLGSLDVSNFIAAAFAANNLISTTTTLTSSANPITTAQTAKFTATVNAASATGNVVFSSNGTPVATVALVAGVAATASLPFTTPGTYTISAAYAGDTVYSGSASTSLPLVVTASGTTVSTSVLTATATSATTAQSVGFTSTTTGAGGTPGGTVQFRLDGATYGAPYSTTTGVVTVAPAPFTAGTHTITCQYSGNSTFAPSNCNTVTLVVTSSSLATSTSITINPSTVATTGATTIGGTVTGVAGNPTPTGTLNLFNGTTNYGSITMINGSVSGPLSIASIGLTPGTYPLFHLVYSGDTVYAPSTSPNATLVVTAGVVGTAASTNTLTVAPSTITPTGQATFVDTISGASGIPTGSVDVYQNGVNVITFPLVSGVSNFTLAGTTANPIPPGTYLLYTKYSGDSVYAASTSPTVTLIVTNSALSVTPAAPSLTLAAGANATDVITFNSTGVTGAVALTCSVAFAGQGTATLIPGCSFTPTSLTYTGNGAQTSTLTITSTAATAVGVGYFSSNHTTPLKGLGGITLAALLFSLLPRKRRLALKHARLLSLLLLLGTLGALAGCGTSNSTSSTAKPGTTKGAYVVTITAAGTSVTSSGLVNLTIQ